MVSDPRQVLPPVEISRVAVIGLGLIGGSVALRCLKRGFSVIGYDADTATRSEAARHFEVAETIAQAVAKADLVVLAVPLKAMATTAKEVAKTLRPDTTVTDVGSVKAPVRAAMEAAGIGDQYIGGHPMAGNEHSGFKNADPMLLVGAPWALTHPNITGEQRRFNEVWHWVSDTFDANVVELTDMEHDRAQALISGLPHIFAVELLNQVSASASCQEALMLKAGSFRDGTRVGYTDPSRTLALVQENATNIVPLLRKTAADLTQLADKLEQNQNPTDFFHAADLLRADTQREAHQ